jgi:hypothetical protein
MVQPIERRTLRTTGEAVPIAEGVQFSSFRWTGNFSLSNTGLLLYLADSSVRGGQLTWFDLDGKELGKVGEPGPFFGLELDPSGQRAVAVIRGERLDLGMYDLARGVGSRFTFGPDQAFFPIWSPDGRQVAYASLARSIFVKAADGASEPRAVLTEKDLGGFPSSWSPDGSRIAFWVQTTNAGDDLWILPLAGDKKPYPFLATPADENRGVFSPDGKWLLYLSTESGQPELYVVPFPGREGKWLISSGGAQRGVWLGDGRRIAYMTLERKLVAVDVTVSGKEIVIGAPRPVLGGRTMAGLWPWAVTRDGKRLLQAVASDEAPAELTLVTHWMAELKR